MMLITMHVGEALHFWALSFTTAYTVLAFFGYLGMVYANPTVDRTIRASAPAVDKGAQRERAALVPFIPRRAMVLVQDQGLGWAA